MIASILLFLAFASSVCSLVVVVLLGKRLAAIEDALGIKDDDAAEKDGGGGEGGGTRPV